MVFDRKAYGMMLLALERLAELSSPPAVKR
jgi:hypothetical protein